MDIQSRNESNGRAYVWVLFLSGAFVFGTSLYTHLYAQDLVFLVEMGCDPSTQQCYTRDCSTEECPPNGLSEYRVFSVNAEQFAQCTDNSCADICAAGNDSCQEIPCSNDETAACIGPTGDSTLWE